MCDGPLPRRRILWPWQQRGLRRAGGGGFRQCLRRPLGLGVCGFEVAGELMTYHYAAIGLELKKSGKPIPTNDLWIAALCRQHALPLISHDRHFDVVKGLERIEW